MISPRARSLARPFLSLALGAAGLFVAASAEALNVDRLEPSEQALLQSTLQHLEPIVTAKKQDGTANILTWEALRQPLTEEERAFLDAFRVLKAETLGSTTPPPVRSPIGPAPLGADPPPADATGGGASHYFGEADASNLVPVGPQAVLKDGVSAPLDPQFLPRPVLEAYQAMVEAMRRDLGKALRVESGYRSPAYQLYLFLFYLPKHGYSIRETNRFVALPGYSEHGNPRRQAIDFINADGVNGEDHPEQFEALPEYRWLQEHAGAFGFVLSYPRDNPLHTAFEPWHWHYEGR